MRRDTGGAVSRGASRTVRLQSVSPGRDQALHDGQVGLEHRRTGCREPVGPPSTLDREGRYPASWLQSREHPVQGARLHPGAVELQDVLHDRVTVFGTLGQAGKHEKRWLGEAAEVREVAGTRPLYRHPLYRIT